jgi:simple sugar transport system ATP-binding protein
VIFITHNVHHAWAVGDKFTVLNRGRTLGTFAKGEIAREELLNMMAGGKELEQLSAELDEFARADEARARAGAPRSRRRRRPSTRGRRAARHPGRPASRH